MQDQTDEHSPTATGRRKKSMNGRLTRRKPLRRLSVMSAYFSGKSPGKVGEDEEY